MKTTTIFLSLAASVLAIPTASNGALKVTKVYSDTTDYPPGNKCSFQAFSGTSCNGDAGAILTVQKHRDVCIGTSNQQSFLLSGPCSPLTVLLLTEDACQGNSTSTNEGAGCYNVEPLNGGQEWRSSYVNN